MSANRSVQAAQRRQTKTPDPPMPGRGPQPSIGSSQMFAAGQQQQQQRPISGRLAGQHSAAMSQQQQQQQQQMSQQQSSASAIGGINKMTIAQAITLITLRLGKIETQLLEGPSSFNHAIDGDEDHILVDKSVIQSLISRIDALEKKPTFSASASPSSNQDIALLKQQFETIKPIVVQSKQTSTALKQQFESLKTELSETKDLVVTLQNLTMDNSTKILAFNSIFNTDASDNAFFDVPGQDQDLDLDQDQDLDQDLDQELDADQELIGTNLKEIIENEFNAEQ